MSDGSGKETQVATKMDVFVFFVRQCMLIESSASSRKDEKVSYAFTRRQRGEIALIPLSSYVRDSFW